VRQDAAGNPVNDILTDAEIDKLISMPKQLPAKYEQLFKPKQKSGAHKESELTISMDDGSKFTLMMREAIENSLDFSAILAYDRPGGGKRLLLRRYNGKSHEHANAIEKGPVFYDFHIHYITERYQRRKGKVEGYAEITNRYGDLSGALDCLIKDCNFIVAEEDKHLFSPDRTGDE
jgi:hypothetical protein